jgi:hypothetical protein
MKETPSDEKLENPMYNLSKLYYGKNTVTVEDLDKTWGQPILLQEYHANMEKRVYPIVDSLIEGRSRETPGRPFV